MFSLEKKALPKKLLFFVRSIFCQTFLKFVAQPFSVKPFSLEKGFVVRDIKTLP